MVYVSFEFLPCAHFTLLRACPTHAPCSNVIWVVGADRITGGLGIIFGPRRTGPDHTFNRTVRKMAESV